MGDDDNFAAAIDFYHHDSNDGEIRFRQKVAGSNTDTLTAVDGRIGIGTTTPDKTLTVHGDISASGIVYPENTIDMINNKSIRWNNRGIIRF